MDETVTRCGRREFLGGGLSFAAGTIPGIRTFEAADADALPSHYSDYLPRIAEKIRRRAKETVDGFWFATDIHLPVNSMFSGRIIAALAGCVPFDKVFCGGDLPYAYVTNDIDSCRETLEKDFRDFCRYWVEPVARAGLRMYTAKGNHDFTICATPQFKSGLTLSGREARNVLMGRFTHGDVVGNPSDPEACYFYVDNAAARIRYVVADTTDRVDAARPIWGVVTGMHEPQMRWLAEQALGTVAEGWSIVLVHHIPMASLVGSDADARDYADFRNLCEAYQNRGTMELFGRKYDFSGARGRILLSITGHHHAERQTFQKGILHVTEPCDMRDRDYLYGSGEWCGELPMKESGTIYEQTFDAVQLDPSRGLVFFTRVGGGQDRVIHTVPVTVKTGGRLTLEARWLKGPVKWGCYDADRLTRLKNPASKWCPLVAFSNEYATMTPDGVLSGIRNGEVMAVAMDAGLNKEIFPVTVV